MTQHHVLNYPWHMTRLAMEQIKRGHTLLPPTQTGEWRIWKSGWLQLWRVTSNRGRMGPRGEPISTHYDHSMYRKGSVCISTTRYLRNPGLISVPITSSEMEFWRRVLGS